MIHLNPNNNDGRLLQQILNLAETRAEKDPTRNTGFQLEHQSCEEHLDPLLAEGRRRLAAGSQGFSVFFGLIDDYRRSYGITEKDALIVTHFVDAIKKELNIAEIQIDNTPMRLWEKPDVKGAAIEVTKIPKRKKLAFDAAILGL